MLPEVYFLRYAFTCARVLVDYKKTITEEEWKKMQEAVENGAPMDREYLEKVFSKPIGELKKISPDYWDISVIREYFWNRHEEAITKTLPPMIKRLCVVRKGKLIAQFGDVFKAKIGENDIRNVNTMYPGPKVGDTVMVHYGYAVEKV
ncbi:hypothetical protein JW851_00910 [Candidatus Woesearchaeota archaeon]|nr:hypothetical protein [Candidatus Woesearchaeota archaeon]